MEKINGGSIIKYQIDTILPQFQYYIANNLTDENKELFKEVLAMAIRYDMDVTTLPTLNEMYNYLVAKMPTYQLEPEELTDKCYYDFTGLFESEVPIESYSNKDRFYTGYELYATLFNRRILDESEDSEDVCQYLYDQLPTALWKSTNILLYRNLYEEDVKMYKLLIDYTRGGYKIMNLKLRSNIDSPAPLNTLIDSQAPLDKDIVVYRYQLTYETLFIDKEILIFNGYMSTSTDVNFVVDKAVGIMTMKMCILKISVPSGSKCYYIGGTESELLFKHRSILKILSITDEPYCYVDEKGRGYYVIRTINVILIK